jgi:2-polyprenyl-3-methyl-5-hydroxy-6-metoxy-1,4-benzoquinol methylase
MSVPRWTSSKASRAGNDTRAAYDPPFASDRRAMTAMKETPPSLYDTNDYYADTASGSRLSPALDGVLRLLERERVRSVLRSTGLSSGKVLDVGAGDGTFLHYMKRRGFTVHGTTTSRRSAKAASSLFQLDLSVTPGLDDALMHAPFDLVTYWHVFEHLDDPPGHFRRWPALVRPGGFLVIEVPNIDSVGARLCYRSWLGSDDAHHVNQQEPASICRTLSALRFDIVRTDFFSAKFSYVFVWSALLGAIFGRPYDFEAIMGILKRPMHALRARPIWTINALAAVLYLAPFIVTVIAYGLAVRRGEVLRVYARRRADAGASPVEVA